MPNVIRMLHEECGIAGREKGFFFFFCSFVDWRSRKFRGLRGRYFSVLWLFSPNEATFSLVGKRMNKGGSSSDRACSTLGL